MGRWFLFADYIGWHYSQAIVAWWQIYRSLLWFLWHFFSFSILLRTFFSPWHRLRESYPRGFNPQAVAETFIVNILMRAVGVFFRLLFLLLVAVVIILVLVVGWLILAVWLAAPFLVIGLLLAGFYLTFFI